MEISKYLSVNELIDITQKHRTKILSGIIVGALAIGGFVYWQYMRLNLEKRAAQALSELLSEYNHAYENNELWQDIEVGARTGFRQYSGSSMAPYFLGLQVDSLIQQDKFDEALLLMGTMMKKLSTSSPLYYSYLIKFARMKLESSDVVNQDEGLKELTKLANDVTNPEQAQAQYYLGLYYNNNNQEEKAQEIWKMLHAMQEGKKEERSPWTVLAEQHLA